jgi:hypothetical protein
VEVKGSTSLVPVGSPRSVVNGLSRPVSVLCVEKLELLAIDEH